MHSRLRAPHSAETPQDVRDQREATAQSAVERIKALAMECKKLSNRSAQTYEKLTENPELQALESQLQESKEASRDNTGAVEAPVSCGKNEAIPREMHHPAVDPHYPEQSYGSNSEAPTCTR
jgi:FtsZ-binding cell division protein ZapB